MSSHGGTGHYTPRALGGRHTFARAAHFAASLVFATHAKKQTLSFSTSGGAPSLTARGAWAWRASSALLVALDTWRLGAACACWHLACGSGTRTPYFRLELASLKHSLRTHGALWPARKGLASSRASMLHSSHLNLSRAARCARTRCRAARTRGKHAGGTRDISGRCFGGRASGRCCPLIFAASGGAPKGTLGPFCLYRPRHTYLTRAFPGEGIWTGRATQATAGSGLNIARMKILCPATHGGPSRARRALSPLCALRKSFTRRAVAAARLFAPSRYISLKTLLRTAEKGSLLPGRRAPHGASALSRILPPLHPPLHTTLACEKRRDTRTFKGWEEQGQEGTLPSPCLPAHLPPSYRAPHCTRLVFLPHLPPPCLAFLAFVFLPALLPACLSPCLYACMPCVYATFLHLHAFPTMHSPPLPNMPCPHIQTWNILLFCMPASLLWVFSATYACLQFPILFSYFSVQILIRSVLRSLPLLNCCCIPTLPLFCTL